MNRRTRRTAVLIAIAAVLGGGTPAGAQAPAKKPNILVIFGDDIGISQVSAYTMGLMGYWLFRRRQAIRGAPRRQRLHALLPGQGGEGPA
jgi:hypothetical protein